MMSIVLPIVLGLQAFQALAVQALNTDRRSSDVEVMRMAAAIEASLKNVLHPSYFKANFVPDDDYIAGLKDLGFEFGDSNSGDLAGARVRRATEPEGNPDDDAEEVTEEVTRCGEGGQPPATGLRRWVIRIRNVMYGRRDLEGTEGGEAEGEPEAGRTWVESLANWFAHGIKRLLIRISGGEGGEEGQGPGGEAPCMDAAGAGAGAGAGGEEGAWSSDPNPAPAARTPASPPASPPATAGPTAKRRTIPTTARSAPEEDEPTPTTPRPRTALPPTPPPRDAAVPTAPSVTTPIGPSDPLESTTQAGAGTVYDDEAYGGSHRAPPVQPVETNELN